MKYFQPKYIFLTMLVFQVCLAYDPCNLNKLDNAPEGVDVYLIRLLANSICYILSRRTFKCKWEEGVEMKAFVEPVSVSGN